MVLCVTCSSHFQPKQRCHRPRHTWVANWAFGLLRLPLLHSHRGLTPGNSSPGRLPGAEQGTRDTGVEGTHSVEVCSVEGGTRKEHLCHRTPAMSCAFLVCPPKLVCPWGWRGLLESPFNRLNKTLAQTHGAPKCFQGQVGLTPRLIKQEPHCAQSRD